MVTVEAWRSSGDNFEWRGQRVFFRVEGSGDPLLLIHGFPTSSWDWAGMWPELVARYRVMTLDMIGFGFSAKPRDWNYSLTVQADLFGALLEREKVTSYRMVAHDMGNSVAQELLARQKGDAKQKPIAACVLNGGLFPEAHHPVIAQKLLASPIGPLFARVTSYRLFSRSMRKIWGRTPPSEEELRAMWTLVTERDGMRVMPQLIGYIAERKRNRERWVGAIVNPPCPVRLINGPLDPVAGADTIARYRELVPNANVVVLEGVGHYPQVEAPSKVLAAVLEHFG
jgi:pimeloyl-ACP methyl ester carboxylesterase